MQFCRDACSAKSRLIPASTATSWYNTAFCSVQYQLVQRRKRAYNTVGYVVLPPTKTEVDKLAVLVRYLK